VGKVKKHLEKKGHQVIVVELPGRSSHPAGPDGVSAEKYRDAIVEAIGGHDQVVLVGHSFGGIQISNVGEAIPDRIHALVYVAAYLPLRFFAGSTARPAAALKGRQISGTTLFQSGLPFHVHTGSDGPGYGNVDGDTQDRPNILNPPQLGKSIDNPDIAPTLLAANTCRRPALQVF
jgi:pimeloyl-ACP methyl ester carboxylesterase